MSHETPTVNAARRDRVGTRYAQRLRKQGRLPAVIYGHKQDPVHVSVDQKETVDVLEEGAHVLNVRIDEAQAETCLVKAIQFGHLGDTIVHLDLARVDLDEEVHVNVSLHFVGEPAALKTPGTVLNHAMNDLEVVCKVSAIPDEIKVDLSEMIETITVADLELPEGVRTDVDPDSPVASITYVAEEEVEGEAAEVEEEGAEPEVITEAKDEAEGGAEAEEKTEE